ncbi:hypothetical protein N9N03_02845, partial [Chlamydiia bacterium]|nr:hypothetical protein [Chlamydiia bacterium]
MNTDDHHYLKLPYPVPQFPFHLIKRPEIALSRNDPLYRRLKIDASVSHTLGIIDVLRNHETINTTDSVTVEFERQLNGYFESKGGIRALNTKMGVTPEQQHPFFIEDLSHILPLCMTDTTESTDAIVTRISRIEREETETEINYTVKINHKRPQADLKMEFRYLFNMQNTTQKNVLLECHLTEQIPMSNAA